MDPFPHQEICERDAGGENTNTHLAGSRSRDVFLDDAQTLGTTEVAHDHPLIRHDAFRTHFSHLEQTSAASLLDLAPGAEVAPLSWMG
jgi:hypothetical protein